MRLTCDRSGFRRTSTVIVPRKWISFRPRPTNATELTTYHPKLVLLSATKRHKLFVSTANITSADQQQANLAVTLEINDRQAKAVRDWIKRPKNKKTFVAIVKESGKIRISVPDERPTFDHFREHIGSRECEHSARMKNLWLVAAPFWSPIFIQRLAEVTASEGSGGTIEAYFREQQQWSACYHHLKAPRRVLPYRLIENGEYKPWHHKLLAWRCCEEPAAKVVVYIGSANATISGMLGRAGRAVNWEAGAIFLGGQELWEHARSAARAQMRVERLTTDPAKGFQEDDEIGPDPEAQIEETLSRHLEQYLLVRRPNGVKLSAKKMVPIPILGKRWTLITAKLLTGTARELKLRSRDWAKVPKNSLTTVRAEYASDSGQYRTYRTIHLDLAELDPDPSPLDLSTGDAAHQFRQLLSKGMPESNGKGRGRLEGTTEDEELWRHSDIRFPFREALYGLQHYPDHTRELLKALLSLKDDIGTSCPSFWKVIARSLLSMQP